ncbi:24516_t:CDS:1, partial [Racocetra persica]
MEARLISVCYRVHREINGNCTLKPGKGSSSWFWVLEEFKSLTGKPMNTPLKKLQDLEEIEYFKNIV